MYLIPTVAGSTSIHVTVDGNTIDLPVLLNATAPDTAYASPAGATIDIAANDLPRSEEIRLIGSTAHGSVSLSLGTIRYTPLPGYRGIDSVRYTTRSSSRTDTATVLIGAGPGPFDAAFIGSTATLTAVDVNDSGQVAGTLLVSSGDRPFRWSSGVIETLYYGPGATRGKGIDNSGTVVGTFAEGTQTRVIRWPLNGTAHDPFDALFPADVNVRVSNAGVIFAGGVNGFLWRNGQPGPAATNSRDAFAVNDNGDVAVNTHPAQRQPFYRPIVYVNGAKAQSPNCDKMSASGLNNAGEIGVTSCPQDANGPPSLYSSRTLTTTAIQPRIQADLRFITQVNDSRHMTGIAIDPVFLVDGTIAYPIRALLADPSLRIDSVVRLNNNDQILVLATNAQGQQGYYLLTPRTR
jgi:hypothetical protein